MCTTGSFDVRQVLVCTSCRFPGWCTREQLQVLNGDVLCFPGARWGIKNTLITGLFLQLVGIGVLFAWQESWGQEGEHGLHTVNQRRHVPLSMGQMSPLQCTTLGEAAVLLISRG